MPDSTGTGPTAYQIKATLRGICPPIWRRFLVTSDVTLHRLHLILQRVMGWYDEHLYEFIIDERRYGPPNPESDAPRGNSHRTRLADVLPAATSIVYRYDLGDCWDHDIALERVLPLDDSVRYPVCLEGERACPPEDCGGVLGYRMLLETISNPNGEGYHEMMDWLGGEFDPEAFQKRWVNAALRRYRK